MDPPWPSVRRGRATNRREFESALSVKRQKASDRVFLETDIEKNKRAISFRGLAGQILYASENIRVVHPRLDPI